MNDLAKNYLEYLRRWDTTSFSRGQTLGMAIARLNDGLIAPWEFHYISNVCFAREFRGISA